GLRRNDSPIPVLGSNSLRMVSSRVVEDSAPEEFISHAAVSVNDAPAPSNCWYVVPSLTLMVAWPDPLPAEKLIGVCCCRPRLTTRPPPSDVVVSQMFTCSPAAWAGAAGM